MDRNALRRDRDALLCLLRGLRQEAGLRQQDLADLLGEPQSFVSKYESGERRLDVLELRRICAAMGLPMSKLLDELEDRLSRPH